MTSIIDDLEILTTIPANTLKKLKQKEIYCIADALEESILADQSVTEVELGIGILTIKHTKDDIMYRFTPSAKLNDAVKNTIINGKNILTDSLEVSLVNNIKNIYKDLC